MLSDPPPRQDYLRYIDRIREHLESWLPQHSDDAYLQPTGDNGLKGECLLDEMLYILRHSQHHLGEMAVGLRSIGIEPTWL